MTIDARPVVDFTFAFQGKSASEGARPSTQRTVYTVNFTDIPMVKFEDRQANSLGYPAQMASLVANIQFAL